jgi:ATP-dependent exoDNAse (exonuclease V) beta subunit
MKDKRFPISDKELKFPHALLLSSSAGSGKTYNLANRYLQYILSEKIPNNNLTNILAITFTENATKEMAERMINFLKEIYFEKRKREEALSFISLKDKDLKEKAALYLDKIFDQYPDFYVGTIDSFIVKLLSISAMELGLSPDFEVVFNDDQLIKELTPEFLSSLKTKDGFKAIDDFLDILNKSGGKGFIFNPLEEIYEKFADFFKKENKYIQKIKLSEIETKDLEKIKEEIYAEIKELKNKHPDLKLNKDPEKYLANEDKESLIEEYDINNAIFNGRIKKTKEALKDNEEHEQIKQKLSYYYEYKSQHFYSPYIKLYKLFLKFSDKEKRNRMAISLQEATSILARKIKKEDIPQIYIKLSAKFCHFLIDEFQDTSPAQWSILRPLAEEAISTKGSLFFIGDTKQAIYMFRNADYKIMSEMKKNNKKSQNINLSPLSDGLIVFEPDQNYRSVKEITDYVKDFFSSDEFKNYLNLNIGSDFTGLLNCEQMPHRKENGYVETICFKTKENPDAEKNFYLKFEEIIKDLSKRYNYSDIAILVKKNEDANEITRILNSLDIPAASYSSLDIRKRKLIKELISFLAFLNRPDDDLNFSFFILGEICSKACFDLKVEKQREFLFEAREEKIKYSHFKERFQSIWSAFFEEIFKKSGYLSVYELLNLIIAKFKIFENFPQEHGYILKFLDCANQLNFKESASSISSFLYNIEELSEEEASLYLPGNSEAVKVMTFHKAKGLGFKVVINLFIEQSHEPNTLIYYHSDGEDLKLYKINKEYCDFNDLLGKIYEDEKKETQVQELNTLYVALTRAEIELYNLALIKSDKKLYSLFKDFTEGIKKENKEQKTKIEYLPVSISSGPLYNFIKNGEPRKEELLRGELYHSLMAEIRFKEDFHSNSFSIKAKNIAAKFSLEKELPNAFKKIETLLKNPQFSFLFEKGKVLNALNEIEIIYENGRICRPDRIIETAGEIFFIDYKTGEKADYQDQIENYKRILEKIFPKKIKALIYYFDLDKAEEL